MEHTMSKDIFFVMLVLSIIMPLYGCNSSEDEEKSTDLKSALVGLWWDEKTEKDGREEHEKWYKEKEEREKRKERGDIEDPFTVDRGGINDAGGIYIPPEED